MQTSTNNTESNQTIPSPTGYVETPKTPDVQTVDETTDEFGYEKTKAPSIPEPKKEETPAPKDDEEVVKTPASGYGKEEEKKEEPKKEETPAPKDEKKDDKEVDFSEAIKELPENVSKEKILAFAKENSLSVEQVKAYAGLLKQEELSVKQAQEEFVKNQRSSWMTELQTDPEFGGENFVKNVDRVEKVLEKYLPNIKKALTERGSMLPPYIMRDFLTLSKVLNPTTNLVNGEPAKVKSDGSNFLDEMYQ